MTVEEHDEAHPRDELIEIVECPYCNEGLANIEDKCSWCDGTGWIDEENT